MSEKELSEVLIKESFPDSDVCQRLRDERKRVLALLKGVEMEEGDRGLLVKEMRTLVDGLDYIMRGTEA